MNTADVVATVALLISFLSVIATALVAVWTLRVQDQQRRRDARSRLDEQYKDVAASMAYLGYICQQFDAGTLWRAVYSAQFLQGHDNETLLRNRDQWLAFDAHLTKVDAFWDSVTKQVEQQQLPPDFPGTGWRRRANNYRLVCEPLFIAKFYRCKFDVDDTSPQQHRIAYLNEVGDKRPHRYKTIEDWVRQRGWRLRSSTVWAVQFEGTLLNQPGIIRANVAVDVDPTA